MVIQSKVRLAGLDSARRLFCTIKTAASNHWLTRKRVGRKNNRDGIGAEIKVVMANKTQWNTVSTRGSYLSSSGVRTRFVPGLKNHPGGPVLRAAGMVGHWVAR